MVRDGWLDPDDVTATVPLADVVDLEEMRMPAVWRRRQEQRRRMTEVVTVEDFDRTSWQRVARAYSCNRSSAFRRIKLGLLAYLSDE